MVEIKRNPVAKAAGFFTRDLKPLPVEGANIDLIKTRALANGIDQDADESLSKAQTFETNQYL